MLRPIKAAALICAVFILVSCLAPAAFAISWTSLSPSKFIADSYYVGDYRYVVYDFQRTPLVTYQYGANTGQAMSSVNLALNPELTQQITFNTYPLGIRHYGGPPLSNASSGLIAIDVSDFRPDASFAIISNLRMKLHFRYWTSDVELYERYTVNSEWSFSAYDVNGAYLGTIQRLQNTITGALQDVPDEYFEIDVPVQLELTFNEFASKVAYIVPYCKVSLSVTEDEPDLVISSVEFTSESFSISGRTDMLLKDSLTLEAIENQLGETNDKLDDILKQPEQEKQEALEDGNEMIGELTGMLPDHSSGFISALSDLSSAMSYEGVEAKLTIPPIKLPAIPGVMKSYQLTDELQVDFGVWFQKMPENILTLVQVLGTLALVVFSFKELYGLIAYAMTLKGGSSVG